MTGRKDMISCIFRFGMVILLLTALTGCSEKTQVQPESGGGQVKSGSSVPGGYNPEHVKKILMTEFYKWEGTPHKMGGNSKKGIDCSGFAYYLYTHLFDTNVPRTTREFAYAGDQIKKSQLRPGDLVVFRPPTYPRHVGVYIGSNMFIHASTSKGVMKSDLDNPYWQKSYWMSRRLIY